MSHDQPTPGDGSSPSGDRPARDYGPPTIGRVVVALRAESPRVIANWVLRVANLPAFRAIPNLHLADIQDVIPEVVTAVLAATAIADPSVDPEPVAYASEVAERHGRSRADAGFGLRVVLVEFQQLRAELGAAVHRVVDEDPALATIMHDLTDRLNYTLDTVLIAAADAWLDARAPGSN